MLFLFYYSVRKLGLFAERLPTLQSFQIANATVAQSQIEM